MLRRIVISMILCAALLPLTAVAGNLDSPGTPASGSNMPTLQSICTQLDTGTLAPLLAGPFGEPASGPGSTMCNLTQLRDKAPVLDTSGAMPGDVLRGKKYWGLLSGSWGLQTGTNFAQRPPAVVRSTGQAASYSAGDDGDLKYGAAFGPRFTDNNNGTVTDNLTGLIWLKNANCFNTQIWVEALGQALGLASGSCGLTDGSIAGDWRLPNRNELMTLVDYSQFNPALPTGHPFTDTQSMYWSLTSYALYSSGAWYVDMGYGGAAMDDIFDDMFVYVWPVRVSHDKGKIGVPRTGEIYDTNGVVWPDPRFIDNGNGTVTDNLTGLIWLKNADCSETAGGINKGSGTLTWSNALTWSNNVANGLCGLSDGSSAGNWRLPSVNELESLLDMSKFSPALPAGHPFTNVQPQTYWSSTTTAAIAANAWFVFMEEGTLSESPKSGNFYVWPVRGGQ